MSIKTFQKLLTGLIVLCSTVYSYSQSDNEKMREGIVAMANIGFCNAGAYASNGKDIVFISNLSGLPQIWKVPATGGWPIQLTAFNDPVTAISVSPKRDLIAFQLSPGGGLNAQIYVMNVNGSDLKQITHAGKSTNFLGPWSRDGAYLSFSSNEQNATGVDFFIYNVNRGKYELAVKNNGTGRIADFAKDNRQVLLTRLASRGSNDLYLYDLWVCQITLLK